MLREESQRRTDRPRCCPNAREKVRGVTDTLIIWVRGQIVEEIICRGLKNTASGRDGPCENRAGDLIARPRLGAACSIGSCPCV